MHDECYGLELLFSKVNSLERSSGFYRDLLGLELESWSPDVRAAMLHSEPVA